MNEKIAQMIVIIHWLVFWHRLGGQATCHKPSL